jgi:hypothetical protein
MRKGQAGGDRSHGIFLPEPRTISRIAKAARRPALTPSVPRFAAEAPRVAFTGASFLSSVGRYALDKVFRNAAETARPKRCVQAGGFDRAA